MATVDFNTGTTLASDALCTSISTYGGNDIIDDATTRATLAALKLDQARFPVTWNNGSPISAADGTDVNTSKSGQAWVDAIIACGLKPIPIVAGPGGSNNSYSSADCANLVTYFGPSVTRYIIGNEPGDAVQPAGISRINNAAIAMKNVRAGIQVWGPAFAGDHWSQTDLDNFLQGASHVDGWDHHYYSMGENYQTTETGMARALSFRDKVALAKSRMTSAGKTAVPPIIGESNWTWSYENSAATPGAGDQRCFGTESSTWVAAACGYTLFAGGRYHQYADLNGPLGLIVENNDPRKNGKPVGTRMPSYFGMAAFSGMSIWPKVGTTGYARTSDWSDLDIFPMSNVDGGRNIILTNRSTTTSRSVTLNLTGATSWSTYNIWKTDRADAYAVPTRTVTDATHSGTITVTVPALTYAVVVLSGSGTITPPPPVVVPVSNVVKIDCGGVNNEDGWLADSQFVSGGNTAATTGVVTNVPAYVPDRVAHTERWGPATWTVPLRAGTYTVEVLASEQFLGSAGSVTEESPTFTGKAATWGDTFAAASANAPATHNAYQTGLDGTRFDYPYSAGTNGYNTVNAPSPFVRVTGGNLEIDCQQSCGNTVSAAYRLDLVSSQIDIQVASMPNHSTGFTGSPFVRIGLAPSGTNTYDAAAFALKFIWIGTSGRLQVLTGGDVLQDETVLGTNVEPKRLRIRHAATGGNGTLYFDYSLVAAPGVGDWVEAHSIAAPASVSSVYVEMFTENGNGGPVGSAGFGTKHDIPFKVAGINTTSAVTGPSGGITAAGQRTFDILVNGVLAVAGLDLFRFGAAKMLPYRVRAVVNEVSGGTITVETRSDTGNPTVNAIVIRPLSQRLT